MRRFTTLLLAAGLAGVAGAPTAVAQAPDDPEAGTPSGTIYEIPLDDGRADAAPGSRAGAADPDGGDRSPLRSENNFGSSSMVPGASGGAGARDERTPGKGPSGGRPVTGGGDGAPTERDAQPAPALRPAAASAPSLSRAVLLIALSVVLAAGLGLAAHRAARRR